jgi:hypothetical protein
MSNYTRRFSVFLRCHQIDPGAVPVGDGPFNALLMNWICNRWAEWDIMHGRNPQRPIESRPRGDDEQVAFDDWLDGQWRVEP